MASDLRTYLSDIESHLLTVRKTVDLRDVSSLINQAAQPVLFDSLKGFPNWRLTDLLMCSRHVQAKIFGVSPDLVLTTLADRLLLPPQPPKTAEYGPCKEVIATGSNAQLTDIPAFQNGEEDMGPALMAMTVCRDPDSGNQNLAWTRMTPLDAETATYFIGSSVHMRSILAKHEQRNEPMPMAFVMGLHPAYEIMGSYSVLDHIRQFGELDMVGPLLGESIEVVPCETQPIMVPSHSEVVIEGYVHGDGRRVDEGPGPSQALYYVPGVTKQPVFQVTAVTRRERPIMRQINTLLYTDHQSLIGLPHEALLLQQLRRLDNTVHDVMYTPWSGTLACVIKVTPRYDGQVREMLVHCLSQRFPNVKLAIAIDDDIDIENVKDIHWSLATRVEPASDVIIIKDMRGHPIDPSARVAAGDARRRLTGKMAIDATKPPVSRPAERHNFRRTLPFRWGAADLGDYL
ncbi:MAG: UbiD family decarboxylase domain-containing protein [Pseudomonadota bacterium]